MVLAQKQNYRQMEQNRKTQKKTHAPTGTLFLAQEARIYNGARKVSSINSAGKTGQLHVKE